MDEVTPEIEPGADLLARQLAVVHEAVLRPDAYQASKRREVSITEFVLLQRSHEWGGFYQHRSLCEALAV